MTVKQLTEQGHEMSNKVVCAASKGSVQTAHMGSLIRVFTCPFDFLLSVKQLTVQHLEFLSLKGSCTGSSESTLAKMPHCWKSHVAYGPVHEILVIITYVQKPPIKAHADVSSGI